MKCIQTEDDDNSAGTIKEAGLPNVEGRLTTVIAGWKGVNTGAFAESRFYSYEYHGFNKYNDPQIDIDFKASNSNPIYGNSETVQPPSIIVVGWQRVK